MLCEGGFDEFGYECFIGVVVQLVVEVEKCINKDVWVMVLGYIQWGGILIVYD